MQKKDLKNGMIVEYRNGQRRLVLDNKVIGDGHLFINCFNDDLICEEDHSLDIVKVYRSTAYSLTGLFKDTCLELIWSRFIDFKQGLIYYVKTAESHYLIKFQYKDSLGQIKGDYLDLDTYDHAKDTWVCEESEIVDVCLADSKQIMRFNCHFLNPGYYHCTFTDGDNWTIKFTEIRGIKLFYSKCLTQSKVRKVNDWFHISNMTSIRPATTSEINKLENRNLIVDKYYTTNNGWIFKYKGLRYNKDFNKNAILFTELYKYSTDYFVKKNTPDSGIGYIEDYTEIREATTEEIIYLKKAFFKDFKEGDILYISSKLSIYKWIINFSSLYNDDVISKGNLYSFFLNGITKSSKTLCSLINVEEVRLATAEEIKLLNPVQEFTVAELEKKLGMVSGTLRIKK